MAMFEILNYSHIIIHQVLMLKNGVFLEVNSVRRWPALGQSTLRLESSPENWFRMVD